MNTTLIVIDSSDDEDDDRISANWTHFVDNYLNESEADHDEAITARIRSKLRKKPRFLLRWVKSFCRKFFILNFFFSLINRNLPKGLESNSQPPVRVTTMNNDYCQLDPKTLKRKPYYRSDFSFCAQRQFRAIRQVKEMKSFRSISSLIFLESQRSFTRTISSFHEILSGLVVETCCRS